MGQIHWIMIFALACLTSFILALKFRRRQGVPLWVGLAITAIMASAVLSPVYLESSNGYSGSVYTFDTDGTAVRHSDLFPVFCVKAFRDCPELEVAQLVGSVTPITDNPKVRRVTIQLFLEVEESN